MELEEIKIEKQQLFRFLKDKNIFRMFIRNFKNYHYEFNFNDGSIIHKNNESIDCIFNDKKNPIRSAFAFYLTNLTNDDYGSSFWEEIATEYQYESWFGKVLREMRKDREKRKNETEIKNKNDNLFNIENVTVQKMDEPMGIIFCDYLPLIKTK